MLAAITLLTAVAAFVGWQSWLWREAAPTASGKAEASASADKVAEAVTPIPETDVDAQVAVPYAPASSVSSFFQTAPTYAHPLQDRIDAAIARGVAFLKRQQTGDGTFGQEPFPSGYPAGCAALGGLTLLEGGIPPSDPDVQKAAAFLRSRNPAHFTYMCSLTVLFLDWLADPQDEMLIQIAALQILAGQRSEGTWSYWCPKLPREHLQPLLTQLRASARTPGPTVGAERPPFVVIPEARIQSVRDDNSNTQFALLALWAARRHGVPADRALQAAAQRLVATQNADGGWGYNAGGEMTPTTPAMTCVGMLGLAMGHGIDSTPGARDKVAADPRIARGLKVLGDALQPAQLGSHYFLWSLERVGVLYDLRTIEGRDWYDLGARYLLDAQNADGSWKTGEFRQSSLVNTCFAVLFLKRSNLVRDLSERLTRLKALAEPIAQAEVAQPIREQAPQKFTLTWIFNAAKAQRDARGRILLAIPVDRPYQAVSYRFQGAHAEEVTRSDGGCVAAVTPAGKTFSLEVVVRPKAHDYRGSLDEPAGQNFDASIRAYLAADKSFDSGSKKIAKLARTLKGEDAATTIANVSNWIRTKLRYSYDPATWQYKTLDEIVDRGYAECNGHAALVTGLCRNCGLPTRSVWGVVDTAPMPRAVLAAMLKVDLPPGRIFISHNWNEVYFAKAGWVPVDVLDRGSLLGEVSRKHFRICTNGLTEASVTDRVALGNFAQMTGGYAIPRCE